MKLFDSSGDARVDAALVALIARVESLLPEAGLGFYLHGSWAASAAGRDSDVDVLALATRRISNDDQDKAEAIGREVEASSGVPLDFHLHRLNALIADPYVDLRRTGRLVYGVDVRHILPEPTLDALARESVLLTCLYVTDIRSQERVRWPLDHPRLDDEFFGRLPDEDPSRLPKRLSWLTSARLAGGYGYAPVSGADALRAIVTRNDPFANWVSEAVRICRQIARQPVEGIERRQLREVCEGTLEFENTTLAVLREAVEEKGRLGPRCAELIRRYVVFGS